jgi:hypothetical protein
VPHHFADVTRPVRHRLHGSFHAKTLSLEEDVTVAHFGNVAALRRVVKGRHARNNRHNRPTRQGRSTNAEFDAATGFIRTIAMT